MPVTRGDIIDSVGATGTVQAVTTVQVGSQVSGNIEWLGADFNSIVKKGQVIARLDPSLFDAQLQQVQANLIQARANLTRANSELDRTKVQLTDAQQKFARAQGTVDAEPDRAKRPRRRQDRRRLRRRRASRRSTASVTQSQAAVTQAQASVNQSQVNRNHTIIEAPIDGIVTQRSVDVGQTVAASMSAPTLFVIAADLTEMQVNANIDEADVGRIRPGQHVTFRVDAYPTDNFEGTVTQIRLQPVVVQNVTTYGTVITVPNKQLKLKPGMTANVKIEIAKRTNTLAHHQCGAALPPDQRDVRGVQAGAAARDDGLRRRRRAVAAAVVGRRALGDGARGGDRHRRTGASRTGTAHRGTSGTGAPAPAPAPAAAGTFGTGTLLPLWRPRWSRRTWRMARGGGPGGGGPSSRPACSNASRRCRPTSARSSWRG